MVCYTHFYRHLCWQTTHRSPLAAHLPALAALGSRSPTLIAVYSRSEKSAADFANAATSALSLATPPAVYHDGNGNSADLDALLARPDITAVIVVLPITLQPSIVRKALAAGKHVISEKPLAPTVEEGLALIREYEATYKPRGLVWRVAENFEVEPGFRAAGAAIREGKIGKVLYFKATVVNFIDETSNKYYQTPWRTVPDVRSVLLYAVFGVLM